VWKLKKAVYGLPEAGREFEKYLDKKLRQLGWHPTVYPGIYVLFTDAANSKSKSKSYHAIMYAYVDDLLIYAPNNDGKDLVMALERTNVKLVINGVPKTIVGVDFKFSNTTVSLSQERYCQSIAVPEGPAYQHPLPLNVLEEDDTTDLLDANATRAYRSLLGSFAYLALTRPDLCYAISYLGKYSHAPTARAQRLLEAAARYAKKNANVAVIYKISNRDMNPIVIRAWCDASFGSHRSPHAQTGYISNLGGCTVEWRSGKQKRVAHSTLKAECEALHECVDRLSTLSFFLRH
jgi:hypothetical protein